jgi:hypothetical protein
MSSPSALRRIIAVLALAAVAGGVTPASRTMAVAGPDRFRITFDEVPAGTILTAGAIVTDSSGLGNNAVVATAFDGSITAVGDTIGTVLAYPANCATAPCPSALAQIAEHFSLDPLMDDFEWGARVLMQPYETADGENIVQKGITDEPGGQWKLQVDKAGGLPSCVVSGRVPGEATDRRVVLRGSLGVADGVWHQVTCRRDEAGLQILVDGQLTGSATMPVVNLDSNAPVTIGANRVTPSPNDQFHGMLDDVFMNAETVASSPPGHVETVASAAGATRAAVRLGVVDP